MILSLNCCDGDFPSRDSRQCPCDLYQNSCRGRDDQHGCCGDDARLSHDARDGDAHVQAPCGTIRERGRKDRKGYLRGQVHLYRRRNSEIAIS